jgi:Zn-dependent M28 family amino/carboxypeptidase
VESGNQPVASALLDAATEALSTHVERLAGDIGERNVFNPSALAEARNYIASEWSRQGYEVATCWYDARGSRCANLEVTRFGRKCPEQILLLGAHYDSVIGSPGANDNASGVAALLELSRLFTTCFPATTIRFVAFVNEEPPFFMTSRQGSLVYARAARQRGDAIPLMVSLETIGYYCDEPGSQRYPPLFRLFYPDKANFIGFVSDFRSRHMMRRLAQSFRAGSDFPLEHIATLRWVPGVAWSDHLSFWRLGYRALMVTDTAFYRYPYYHSAEDTPEKLVFPELARVTEGLFHALARLSEEGLDRSE